MVASLPHMLKSALNSETSTCRGRLPPTPLMSQVQAKRGWEERMTGPINILTKIPRGQAYAAGVLCPVSKLASPSEDGWEMLEITADSGACDTVLPSGMLASIQTMSTTASRAMEEYEVASGAVIIN